MLLDVSSRVIDTLTPECLASEITYHVHLVERSLPTVAQSEVRYDDVEQMILSICFIMRPRSNGMWSIVYEDCSVL